MLSAESSGQYTLRRANGTFLSVNDKASAGIFASKIKGTKLDDLDALAGIVASSSISVGYRDGAIHRESGLTYAFLASILELGTKDGRIPARPYFRLSSQIVVPSIDREILNQFRKIGFGTTKVTKSGLARDLSVIADLAAEKTKQVIRRRSVGVLDNAPSTLRGKDDPRPWIKNGDLVNAIVGQVRVR